MTRSKKRKKRTKKFKLKQKDDYLLRSASLTQNKTKPSKNRNTPNSKMSPNESTKSFNKRLCQEVKHRSRARPKIRVLPASGSHPSSICSITAQASMAQMPSKRSSRCLSKAISKGVGA